MKTYIKISADKEIPFIKRVFGRLGKIETFTASRLSPKKIYNADILLVRSVTKINETLLKGSKIKFVGSATSGIDHIDRKYLRKMGIKLAYAPGSNANSVAEYVIACLFSLARRKGFSLAGKTIGVIGVGNVGKKVVEKCGALGMSPLLNDPPLARRTGNKKYLPLNKLFNADIITLHVPLTYRGRDATYHLANEKIFEQLKDNVIFVNTSRGATIDEKALIKFIRTGKFRAVVLDVWEEEPNINIELSKLVDIGTPHIAGYSLDGKAKATVMLYKALCKFFKKADTFSPMLLLPPGNKIIEVDYVPGNDEKIIGEIIKGIYNPEIDDNNLRNIIELSENRRGNYFELLRRCYPIRREFYNTKLVLKNAPIDFEEKLRKLRFHL